MFGYVNIDKDNISDEQFTVYKGIYCSLCKTMGKEYSFLSRFTLSYDCTFYALVIMSLQDEMPRFNVGKCTFNPFHKCNYCVNEKALSMAAALSISSAYYKIIDDINDSAFIKKIILRIILPVFKKWNLKAEKKYPQITALLSDLNDYQKHVEASSDCILDLACDPTAKMLSGMCKIIPDYINSKILNKDINKSIRILSQFGYYLGRWVYLMDALDDYESDLNNNGFNPFIIKFGNKLDKEAVERLLNHCLSELMLAYELLDKGWFDSIISNIIFLGLPKKQKMLLNVNNEKKRCV